VNKIAIHVALNAYASRLDALVMTAPKVCLLTGNIGTGCGRIIGYPTPEPDENSDYAPWRVFRRLPREQQCDTCASSRYAEISSFHDSARVGASGDVGR
jgi:hypothetical protein